MKRTKLKYKMRLIVLTLLLVFSLSFEGIVDDAAATAFADSLYEKPEGLSAEEALNKVCSYMYNLVSSSESGDTGGEWVLYGLSVADFDMSEDYLEKYKNSVEKNIMEGYRGIPGILHSRKYTEYSRVVYCYGNLSRYVKEKGYDVEFDPSNVAGYNLLEKLADFDRVVWQGINGPIWALQALDSNDYTIPEITGPTDGSGNGVPTQATRQMYIDYILQYQHSDGGWSMDIDDLSGVSDPDVTGMAVQALSQYRSQSKVKKAVDEAVICMSKLQNADGTYSCYGAKNSESAAQIVMALSRLGIDAGTDERFIKGGNSSVDAILMFYDEKTGGFKHVNEAQGGYEATVNQMATEQACYALANYVHNVPKARIVSLKSNSAKTLKVSIEGQAMADGYELTVSSSKKFSKGTAETVMIKNSAKKTSLSKTVKKLKSGKKYYARVRAYRIIDGRKTFGEYSSVRSVKVQ